MPVVRSPLPSPNLNDAESNCAACDRPDTVDEMVQCDRCNEWWHYSCVGVTSSVSERAWSCSKCNLAANASSVNSVSGHASLLADTMQRLVERQELEKQRVELELQKKFLEEQQKLFNATVMEEIRSQKSRASRRSAQNRVNEWLDSSGESALGVIVDPLAASQIETEPPAGPTDSSDEKQLGVSPEIEPGAAKSQQSQRQLDACDQQKLAQEQIIDLREQLEQCKKLLTGLHMSNNTQVKATGTITKSRPKAPEVENRHVLINNPCQSLSTNPPTTNTNTYNDTVADEELNNRDSMFNLYGAANQRNRPILSRNTRVNSPSNPQQLTERQFLTRDLPSNTRVNLSATPQQIAARHSLARDLPCFSGNPSDWPIFISNFNYTTKACGYTDGENMVRLQRCLKGHVLETVRSRLVLPQAVPHVIETLRMRYGRPEVLINSLLRDVRAIPAPKSEKLEGLIEYGMAVQALCDHIEAADEQAHLANPTLLQELVGKLPADQKLMWAGYRRGVVHVNLRTFCDYMSDVVRDASSVVLYEPGAGKTASKEKSKNKGYTNTHAVIDTNDPIETKTTKSFECHYCGKQGHRLRECNRFKALSVDDRWRKVRELGLCHTCLFRHGRRSCRSTYRCTVDGCQYRHHALLHSGSHPAENHTHRYLESSFLFRIVPVTVYGKSGSTDVFAFLDEGSTLTLIEGELATQLGIEGSPQPLCLHWTGNVSRSEKDSQRVCFELAGTEYCRRFKITEARTVGCLNLPSQSFHREQAEKRYKHLKGLPLPSYANAVPKLLIGIDNLRLALPLKVKEGDGNGPVAVKTRLGWCVYGQQRNESSKMHSFHICECNSNSELHEVMKQFFAIEQASVKIPDSVTSEEDRRAQHILESTTKRIGNQFETGLLWVQDEIVLPNSYPMAMRRLKCLERRMERNPPLKENLHQQLREYSEKGYAHRATNDELTRADPNRVWYLPLGAVTNAKKPGKVRIIWDAAAKVDGVSLNSVLLKGPDQLASLPGVLFRFRLYQVAVSADIQQMFHQLRIRDADKHSQRFLWRFNLSEEPSIYLMDVATFGSTCSPASAQYIKNLNAMEHSEKFPRAVQGIIDSHYVDDYLDSFSSEEEAKQIAEEVRLVNRNGGFTLRGWRSNNENVLDHLGEPKTVNDKTLWLTGTEGTERVLGLLWFPRTDELRFSTQMSEDVVNLIAEDIRPTKRQILRCVMTLFDPLGLLAPFSIHGKVLIQNLWRTGADWDEEVDDNAYDFWRRWTKMIEFISTVHLPRCYFPGATENTYTDAQLHVFVDASETAYSCAVYLRTIDINGDPQCVLVTGKAKVAPVKPMSVPRLELQGCVLGTRLMKFFLENHRISVTRRVLWTDSTTALSWILADPRNYRPFVAHRVGEILESSKASEWRWVPSRLNPADEATKWGSGPYFSDESKWFGGPSFLLLSEENWPKSAKPSVATTEELRPSSLLHVLIGYLIDYNRFSRWERLHHTIAYVNRFVYNIRSVGPRYFGHLQQEELLAAKETIFKQVQAESYMDEMILLKRNLSLPSDQRKPLHSSSPLHHFMPVLDDRGLIRQYSRVRKAQHLSTDMRYPIIMPKDHHVTLLLIDWYHRTYRHANHETVCNEIRQVFTIPRLRTMVRRISRECQFCKIRRAQPQIPVMAPLPAARLADHVRPFTYTGIDYFGPLLVKIGRSNVKRWIALFTCLTVRAVHLEIAYSLSTASCISCVRRFVSRRGSPVEFFTDNGTNFQGAERILREQINQGLSATFTNASTKWTFIPPGAPHMGGVWEHLVRSVKTAMGCAYSDEKLDDEGLQTLVVEVEGLVNSRPLTYLPIDSEESEALTPNHFLLGSSSGVKQPVVPLASRTKISRDTLTQIQQRLDVFWTRWLLEYMPVIRRQSKWFGEVKAIEEGDLVLIVEEAKRNGWTRGRVVAVTKDSEGRVRQAIVQTSSGQLRRPVSKLALLDVGKARVVLIDGKIHPGEDVDAADDPATLPA
ncbi:uncharacterized protein LOC131434173 [Malaya genurostris]|uniref:uncharacterized protein LOC131434173 n=1 Tax=Malaya genurostris TaxID=325434 RepID=UPI0026F3A963|nr:uncharacterized protein LOC131434173 [Malaya genurostris]